MKKIIIDDVEYELKRVAEKPMDVHEAMSYMSFDLKAVVRDEEGKTYHGYEGIGIVYVRHRNTETATRKMKYYKV